MTVSVGRLTVGELRVQVELGLDFLWFHAGDDLLALNNGCRSRKKDILADSLQTLTDEEPKFSMIQ